MKRKTFFCIIAAALLCGICAGCSADRSASAKTIHVSPAGSDESGKGTEESPYKSVGFAVSKIEPGVTVCIHEGEYEPFVVNADASGTAEKPVEICAADGEKVIIKAPARDDGKDCYAVFIENADNITVKGLEIVGGTHGIYYQSNPDRGDKPLENITISDCTVHDVVGTHGICVYAKNDLAPVKNITMDGCEVYNCRCDSSESTVFNGNIDGFTISNNTIHDNNNIGIDMIGFEGNAKHSSSDDEVNPYEVDYVRNGKCFGNTVYNISAFDNEAYYEDGDYDLCADGIYVDGGQNIEIYDNFVFNCDIGIEVATEHSPDDNELFRVSDINVHDNVVAACMGWCGLAFGGYDRDLGYTENCSFCNNTFVDNGAQIGVQRSKNNTISRNIFAGSNSVIEFNSDCRNEDLVNNEILSNLWCSNEGKTPDTSVDREAIVKSRKEALDGFKSLTDSMGSSFVPGEKELKIYKALRSEGAKGIKEASRAFDIIADAGIMLSDLKNCDGNVTKYINEQLKDKGIDGASVALMKAEYGKNFIDCSRNENNGRIDSDKAAKSGMESVEMEFCLRYNYNNNSWTQVWKRNVELKLK